MAVALDVTPEPDNDDTTATMIRVVLALRGKPRAFLADVLGVSPPQITSRMTGKVDWRASELAKIARALEVPVGTFSLDPRHFEEWLSESSPRSRCNAGDAGQRHLTAVAGHATRQRRGYVNSPLALGV